MVSIPLSQAVNKQYSLLQRSKIIDVSIPLSQAVNIRHQRWNITQRLCFHSSQLGCERRRAPGPGPPPRRFHSSQLGCEPDKTFTSSSSLNLCFHSSQLGCEPHTQRLRKITLSVCFHSSQLGCEHSRNACALRNNLNSFHSSQLGCELLQKRQRIISQEEFPFLLVRL